MEFDIKDILTRQTLTAIRIIFTVVLISGIISFLPSSRGSLFFFLLFLFFFPLPPPDSLSCPLRFIIAE